MELESMFEKVEQFVRWVADDDGSYSVSKTTDSRTIIIQRLSQIPTSIPTSVPTSMPLPPSSYRTLEASLRTLDPFAPTSDGAQHEAIQISNLSSREIRPGPGPGVNLSSMANPIHNGRYAALRQPALNPETPAYQPISQPSSVATSAISERTPGAVSPVVNGVAVAVNTMAPRRISSPPRELPAPSIGNRPSTRRGISANSISAVNRHLEDPGQIPPNNNFQLSSPPEPAGYRFGQALTIHPTWIEETVADASGVIFFYGHGHDEGVCLELMTVKIAAAMDAEAIKESPPIRLGVYVLTPHEAGWSRGVVTQLLPGSKASVFFLDYGSVETLAWTQLYLAPLSLCDLPPCFARRFRVISLPSRRKALLEWLKDTPNAVLEVQGMMPDEKVGKLYDVEILNFQEIREVPEKVGTFASSEEQSRSGSSASASTKSQQRESASAADSAPSSISTAVSASAISVNSARAQVAATTVAKAPIAAASVVAPPTTPGPSPTPTIIVSSAPLAVPSSVASSIQKPTPPPASKPSCKSSFLSDTPRKAFACGCEDLNEIFLQSESAGAILDELDVAIKEYCETNQASLKPIESPMIGTKGVSKFGDTFFRCKIVKVMEESMVLVQYLDYGNKDRKSIQKVFISDPKWDSIEPLAHGPFKLVADKSVYSDIPPGFMQDTLEGIIGLEEVEYSVSLDSNGVMIIIDSNNNSVNASVEEKLAPFMKSTTTTGAASLTTTAAASQKTTIATSQTTTTVVPTTKITTCDDETQKLSTPKQPSLSSRDSAENVPFDPTTPTKDGASSANSGINGIRALQQPSNNTSDSVAAPTSSSMLSRLVSDLPTPVITAPSLSKGVSEPSKSSQTDPSKSKSIQDAPVEASTSSRTENIAKRIFEPMLPMKASVAFVAFDDQVYFHMAHNSVAMEATTNALDSLFASKKRPQLKEPKKGTYGCAIFEEDGQPYRCR